MEAVLYRQTGNVSIIHFIYLNREKKNESPARKAQQRPEN